MIKLFVTFSMITFLEFTALHKLIVTSRKTATPSDKIIVDSVHYCASLSQIATKPSPIAGKSLEMIHLNTVISNPENHHII